MSTNKFKPFSAPIQPSPNARSSPHPKHPHQLNQSSARAHVPTPLRRYNAMAQIPVSGVPSSPKKSTEAEMEVILDDRKKGLNSRMDYRDSLVVTEEYESSTGVWSAFASHRSLLIASRPQRLAQNVRSRQSWKSMIA
jgi:hypothetical protein